MKLSNFLFFIFVGNFFCIQSAQLTTTPSSTDDPKIYIQATDGEPIEISKKVAETSAVIKEHLKDLDIIEIDKDNPVPLPEINLSEFNILKPYMEKIKNIKEDDKEIEKQQINELKKQLSNLIESDISDIIVLADKLNIEKLIIFSIDVFVNILKKNYLEENHLFPKQIVKYVNSFHFPPEIEYSIAQKLLATIPWLSINDKSYTFPSIEFKHTNGIINFIQFSPDDKILITGDLTNKELYLNNNGILRVSNSLSGEFLHNIDAKNKNPYVATFAHLSSQFAVGYTDGDIILWDALNNQIILSFLKNIGVVTSLAFSYDDKYLAAGYSNGTVILWDISTGIIKQQFNQEDSTIATVRFSHNNQLLAISRWTGDQRLSTVKIIDLINNTTTTLKHRASQLVFNKDDSLLASGDNFGIVKIWYPDSSIPQKILEIKHIKIRSPVTNLSFLNNDSLMVSYYNNIISAIVWDIKNGNIKHTIDNIFFSDDLSLNPDKNIFATNSGYSQYSTISFLFDTYQFKLITMLQTDANANCFIFNNDGTQLAAGLKNGDIVIWQLINPEIGKDCNLSQALFILAVYQKIKEYKKFIITTSEIQNIFQYLPKKLYNIIKPYVIQLPLWKRILNKIYSSK